MTSIETDEDLCTGWDTNFKINGVYFRKCRFQRFSPHMCVISDTLVHCYVNQVVPAESEDEVVVAGVRLSDLADKELTDFASRWHLIKETLKSLLNSSTGHHLFEGQKKVWDTTNNSLVQPCIAWNLRCPLAV